MSRCRKRPAGRSACKRHDPVPPDIGKNRTEEASLRKLIGLFAACLALSASAAMADEVGKVGVDWIGNDIMIDAIKDPKVDGVTCHVAYFDRSIIDRLHKGNWFEDPSDSSISCRQTGPITIGDIDMSEGGEEVFKQGLSLIWKKQVVNRIYDKKNETLIYLSHSRQVQNGSAKMSVTTVPLYGQNVVWTKGKPQ
ncbi:CREA protein [Mesorhizobium sp. B3-1-7]|nr:CREA protein [Mesorhizobium sp. B3-1-7]